MPAAAIAGDRLPREFVGCRNPRYDPKSRCRNNRSAFAKLQVYRPSRLQKIADRGNARSENCAGSTTQPRSVKAQSSVGISSRLHANRYIDHEHCLMRIEIEYECIGTAAHSRVFCHCRRSNPTSRHALACTEYPSLPCFPSGGHPFAAPHALSDTSSAGVHAA